MLRDGAYSESPSLSKGRNFAYDAPAVCGVSGVFHFDGRPALQEVIRAMNRALVHRGPDDSGEVILGSCGLGHRRLSIIDLSQAGRQPMSSDDGRHWISYNGEVYNYLEIRAELEGLGHRFRTRTDTEVILTAFRQWGGGAFSRFNGMWALAIYDAAERTLTLSRDRFGVKPLVFALDARRILFASEAKALLAAEPALARADLTSIARVLARPALAHAQATFFEGVEPLEPGSVLTVKAGGEASRRRYWDFVPPSRSSRVTMQDAKAEIRELLVDSIRLRFRSDVPVGTCLSGGIDSSSIVSLAHRFLGEAPETFTVLYDEPDFAEGAFAREMIDRFGLRAHVVRPDGRDAPEVIERATYFQDGPSSSVGVYSQWQVMKLAQGRVKVLLDGQGGDEVFGGYLSHYLPSAESAAGALLKGRILPLAHLVRDRREIREAIGMDPVGTLVSTGLQRIGLRKLLRGARMARRLFGGGPERPAPARPRLLSRDLQVRLGDRELWALPKNGADPLHHFLWEQVVSTSLPALLHYEDRDSMAFSIEARTPFLDYRLVERAFALPFDLKVDGSTTKAVLREAMRGILPELIRGRRDKKGYPTPLGRWLREQHREWLRDLVASPRSRARGMVDASAAERLLQQHESGAADYSAQLYLLATLEIFMRRFVDHPPEMPR
jgi:asparagine synthase (glutamine-hydrolysing)